MKSKEVKVITNEQLAGKTFREVDPSVIKSAKLRQSLTKYAKAVKVSYISMWDMVKQVSIMVNSGQFKEDFATQAEFAKFLCISDANLSRMVKLGLVNWETANLIDRDIEVTAAYELCGLKGKTEEELTPQVIDVLNSMDNDDKPYTQKNVREAVAAYKEKNKPVVEGEPDRDEKEEDTEGGNSGKLTDYDDTEKELIEGYELPVYSKANGGTILANVMLTETQLDKLAEVITKTLANMAITIE